MAYNNTPLAYYDLDDIDGLFSALLNLRNIFPSGYIISINGYVVPIIIIITVITNTLVLAVLFQKHMRNPTNVLLAAMALSDTLTELLPFPVFIYFFSVGHYKDFVPYGWCYPYKFLYEVIPTIFHTASIWLTVGLAAQRYIYICHPLKARMWCSSTIPNVIRSTLIVYLVAFLSQLTRFIDFSYLKVTSQSYMEPNITVTACVEIPRDWVLDNMTLYLNIYFWFRIIFIHLVPCTSLVVLNGLLIHAMRKAERRRMYLLNQNKNCESRKIMETNSTTLMLVAVVGLFLLVEFPLGVIMTVYVAENTFDLEVFTAEAYLTMTSFSNFFILLSYPLDLFIYCGMCRQFRETFVGLFRCRPSAYRP